MIWPTPFKTGIGRQGGLDARQRRHGFDLPALRRAGRDQQARDQCDQYGNPASNHCLASLLMRRTARSLVSHAAEHRDLAVHHDRLALDAERCGPVGRRHRAADLHPLGAVVAGRDPTIDERLFGLIEAAEVGAQLSGIQATGFVKPFCWFTRWSCAQISADQPCRRASTASSGD